MDPQVNDGPSSVSRWDLEPGAGRHGAAKGRKELGAPVTATDSTVWGPQLGDGFGYSYFLNPYLGMIGPSDSYFSDVG